MAPAAWAGQLGEANPGPAGQQASWTQCIALHLPVNMKLTRRAAMADGLVMSTHSLQGGGRHRQGWCGWHLNAVWLAMGD